MRHQLSALSAAALLGLTGGVVEATAQPVETNVLVRAVSNDAKIIGSNVGGVRITITDAETGQVMAEGVQTGGTGSTELIMTQPRERGVTVYDTEGAAGFLATLELDEPTRVEIAAEGPLGTPGAEQRTTKTLLLVPGHDVLGEGVILVLNGFTIRIEAPQSGPAAAGAELPVRAHVEMLCGCPIEPGGLWDADRMRVVARLLNGGEIVEEVELAYAGERSKFEGTVALPAGGATELEVLALDPERGNFGRATVTLGEG